jgi:hypothetical protein
MKTRLSLTSFLFVIFGAVILFGVRAEAQDTVAVITEIKLNRGDVQVRSPGKKAGEKPALLQSLYAGSQIQATKDASAVVLFTDGMKTVTVNEKNSPFEVKPGEGKAASGGVKEAANSLLGKKKPPTYVALAVRSGKQAPVLVSPRNTKLMTDSPTFQWMGMERQPGTVRIYGPEGLLWSAENIALTQIKYPASAPRLKPGVEYSWTIEKKGFPVEKVLFKLVPPEEAKAVEEKVASLDKTQGLSKNTVAILKAGLLTSRELYHDAREALSEAVKDDPDEPTLHFLLADIYDKTGLKNLAGEEYSESDYLLKQKQ